jgi:choline dehydrogenase
MPYFLRSEHWWGEPSQVHGEHGPLSVAPMRDFHPMCRVFLNGCAEVGLPTLGEYNGGDMEGAFLTQATQRNGWRCSTEKAFLRPVRSRPNLRVVTYAEADRVLFEGRRATGVAFTRAGVRQQVNAKRELIVSAGSMGSPALLMRSGVGPGADLRAAGIPVIKDLPQVGGNLQEHCAAGQSRLVNRPTLNSQVGPLDMASHAVRFMFGRKGPFGAPAVQAMAMARTRDDLNEPDVQLNFLPLIYDIAPDSTSSASVRMSREPAVTISATVAHPHSRGRVVLGPDKRARIAHQLIGDPRDVGTLVGAMKLIERVFDTKAFADCVTAHRTPPSSPASDEAWAEFVRSKAVIVYHPVGTCRMGSDPEAVVDPQLRVNGVGALRVADASIMPRVTSTNTNAPTIMIGEKAAEMVRGAAP